MSALAPIPANHPPLRLRNPRSHRLAPQCWSTEDAPIPASNACYLAWDDNLTVEVRVDRMFRAERLDDVPDIDIVRGIVGDGLVIDRAAVLLAIPDIRDRLDEAWRCDDL